MTRAFAIFLPLLIAMLAAAPAYAADMTIDGRCSLSEAIDNANEDRQVHADCPAGHRDDIIHLAGDITLREQLFIKSRITIQGGGTISGGNSNRMFFVGGSGTLTLKNLTLRDGKGTASRCPGLTKSYQGGWAIVNLGALNIVDSVFSGNSTSHGGAIFSCPVATLNISGSEFSDNSARSGGAIFNWGEASISDTVFSGNSADNSGGAIYNDGEASISGSEFSGNSARRDGGAIFNDGVASISDSVFEGNSAVDKGGAIRNDGEASISGSEFRGNSARFGGAILTGGEASISGSVFDGNSADNSGGAIYNDGEASISDSVFEGNSARSYYGGAILNHEGGEVLLGRNHFSDNSPDDCIRVTCVSRPLSEMRTVEDDSPADDPPAEEPAPATEDAPASDPPPTTAMPNPSLLAVEHVACTPDDIYLILTLKSGTPDKDRLFEVLVSADGGARILDIAPLPKAESLPERLASVTAIALIGDGLDIVTGFPLAGTVFIAGAELYQWIDEQFTSGGGPLSFRLTWYNTSVHPGITRWLVHATRSGAGNLRISTRLAPLSEIASFTRDAATDDTFSTGVKDSIDVALYMMGGGLSMADEAVGSGDNLLSGGASWLLDLAGSATDLLGRAADTDLAEKAIDWLMTPAEYALDTLVTNPVAYWSERFFTNAGETTAPVDVC